MLDEWSIKEKLALASSVVRSGDHNWMMVSRLIRPFAHASRPLDWFTQTNCARQYAELLKLVEGPRRKRGDGEGENTPGEIIVRKLTSERIEELKSIIAEHAEKYRSIREELEDIKSGKYDGQMKEKWMNLQTKKREDAELIAQKLKIENDIREKVRQANIKSHRLVRNSLTENQPNKKQLSDDMDLKINSDIFQNTKELIDSADTVDDSILQVDKNLDCEKSFDIDISSNDILFSESINDDPINKIETNVLDVLTTLIADDAEISINTDKNNLSPINKSAANFDVKDCKGTTFNSVDKSPKLIDPPVINLSPIKLSEKLTDAVSIPLKLSPIKISRDLLSPIGSGSAFKIFQKEMPDLANTANDDKDESLIDPKIEVAASNDVSLNIPNQVGDILLDTAEDSSIKEIPVANQEQNTHKDTDKSTNDTIDNEDMKFQSEEVAVEEIPNKTELSDDEAKNKSDYLTSNINDKSFFEYVSNNANMKLKFDVNDSFPGSPASISNSDTEDERSHKIWKKSIMLVWRAIANHKFANVFLHPVTEDIAPGYHSIVLRPMDLITIRKNIDLGIIRSASEFQRDVMLMFVNAIMYNNSNQYVHQMARTMFQDAMAQIEQFVSTQMMVQTEPKLLRTLRRSEAAVLSDKGEDEVRKRKTIDSETTSVKKKKN